MLKKGIISLLDIEARTAEVFIPELDNVVTPMIPLSKEIPIENVTIGAKCVIALFSSNFADGAIIAII